MSSMFSSSDPDEFEIMGLKKEGGGEKRKVCLIDDAGTRFSLENLREEIKTAMKDRKEYLDKVFSFGAGLLNDNKEAFGFMVGWLTSRILSTYEIKAKTNIEIQMESQDLNRTEVIDNTIEEVTAFLAYLKEHRNNPDMELKDIPRSPIKSDLDGMEEYD